VKTRQNAGRNHVFCNFNQRPLNLYASDQITEQ